MNKTLAVNSIGLMILAICFALVADLGLVGFGELVLGFQRGFNFVLKAIAFSLAAIAGVVWVTRSVIAVATKKPIPSARFFVGFLAIGAIVTGAEVVTKSLGL